MFLMSTAKETQKPHTSLHKFWEALEHKPFCACLVELCPADHAHHGRFFISQLLASKIPAGRSPNSAGWDLAVASMAMWRQSKPEFSSRIELQVRMHMKKGRALCPETFIFTTQNWFSDRKPGRSKIWTDRPEPTSRANHRVVFGTTGEPSPQESLSGDLGAPKLF